MWPGHSSQELARLFCELAIITENNIVYNLKHQTEFKSLEGEPTATFIDILLILALYNNSVALEMNLVCSIWKIYTFNYMIGHISTTQKEPVYLRWTQFFT
jgi:hypothetical protein